MAFESPSVAKTALKVHGKLHKCDNEIERDFIGLTVLATPKQPSVDIIAIHGLNGHAYGTWCSNESEKKVMWLRDFLSHKVEKARIVVYGYNSIILGPNTSVSVVKDFAYDLLQRNLDDRIRGKIVDEVSSRLGIEDEVLIPIDSTDSEICKYRSSTDAQFLLVLAQIETSCIATASINNRVVPGPSTSVSTASHFLVPTSRNPHFLGRSQELQIKEDYLDPANYSFGSENLRLAIHVLGGVGISSQAQGQKAQEPIFWVTATSEELLESELERIGKGLKGDGISAVDDAKVGCDPQVTRAGFSSWTVTMIWVQVFTIAGSVLITTRDRRVVGAVARRAFELTAMGVSDAESLFLRIQSTNGDHSWQRPSAHSDYRIVQQIVAELHCFPLAIDQAAAFIREDSPMTFEEYLKFLQPRSENRELLMRFKEANPVYPESIMTTWEISLRYLEKRQSRASWILQLLGFFDSSRISEELLRFATKSIKWTFASTSYHRQLSRSFERELAYLKDDVNFRIAIGKLASWSLIKRHINSSDGCTLSLQPLVHEWIRVRLNMDSAQQTRLTIIASLVMYQALPMELVFGLYDSPPTYSSDCWIRYDRVFRHLPALLLNLEHYHACGVEVPLESFVLYESFFYLAYQPRSIAFLEMPKALLRKLDQTIRFISSRLQQGLARLCLFIHNMVVWLQKEKGHSNSLVIVSKAAKALKTFSLTIELDDQAAMFLMLLITTCTDVVSTLDKSRQGAEAVTSTSVSKRKTSGTEDSGVTDKRSLLYALHQLLYSRPFRTHLVKRIALFAKYRLVQSLTPETFAMYPDLAITEQLSSEALEHLGIDAKGSYVCLFARMIWESPGPRDLPAIKAVFELVIKAKLKGVETARREQEDQDLIQTWSHSSYISSSFGRKGKSGSTTRKPFACEDLVSPLDYIWSITLEVAEAISDPHMR
ncbi:hypothetical protein MMC13_002005 [Lambiella insularis]|nr:hypothetical protein [Lambiella insularis]